MRASNLVFTLLILTTATMAQAAADVVDNGSGNTHANVNGSVTFNGNDNEVANLTGEATFNGDHNGVYNGEGGGTYQITGDENTVANNEGPKVTIVGSNNYLGNTSGTIVVNGSNNSLANASGNIQVTGDNNHVNGSNLNVIICGSNHSVSSSGTFGCPVVTPKPPVVDPPPPKPVTPICQITEASCPNHPQQVGTFADNYLNASSNPAECMNRAVDYYRWCGDSPRGGQQVTAVFSIGSAILEKKVVSPKLIPVYRQYNPRTADHAFSRGFAPVASGYFFEGVAFSVADTQISGYIPLYQCVWQNGRDHFLSQSSTCEGQQVVGLLGYTDAVPSSLPLYRFYNVNTRSGFYAHHFESLSYNEGIDNQFYLEGVLGYTW